MDTFFQHLHLYNKQTEKFWERLINKKKDKKLYKLLKSQKNEIGKGLSQ